LPPPHATSADSGRAGPPAPELARATELLEAGMDVEAGWERAQRKGGLETSGPRRRLAALLIPTPGKKFSPRLSTGRRPGGDALATLPQGPSRAIWEAAYPRASSTWWKNSGRPRQSRSVLVRHHAQGIGFGADDVSYADARGLLQMIPPTSARVAAFVGEPFFPDQLFEPHQRAFGASYIGALYRKFRRASAVGRRRYNAGPRAMTPGAIKHEATHREFVELVAFARPASTSNASAPSTARYRFFTAHTFELPLTLNPHLRAEGPDY